MTPSRMRALAGVARLPFLLLPVTLVAVGGAAAAYGGAFSWLHTVVALVGLTAVHVAVNALNEWSDMRTGIDLRTTPTPFSGGSGMLPQGFLPARTAWRLGWAGAAVGVISGSWLVGRVGWSLLPLMLLGAFFVLAYTEWLTKVALGELAAGLGLGGLPVIGTALAQDGTLGWVPVLAAVPATCMTFNLLLLNEFPDEAADRAGGRRHLVIRFGRSKAAALYITAALCTPLTIGVGVVAAWLPPLAALAMLPSLLLVRPLRWAFTDPGAAVPLPALGANVMWNLATNAVLAATLAASLLR